MRSVRRPALGASRALRVVLALHAALAGAGVAHAAVAPSPSSGSACPAPNDTNHLVADATKPGVIDLLFFNAKGARVSFYECVGERLERIAARRVGAETQPTMLAAAATWSCDRLVRNFAAFATLPDGTPALGTYSVRTASCANRFQLSVPRRVRPGSELRVRVADRWGIGGIRPQLCVTPPSTRRSCRTLAFQPAVTTASRRFRTSARGRWRVELRVRDLRERASVAVGGEAGSQRAQPPAVLATGDSTMQGIDSFLADELGDDATVHSDVLPGSGISRGGFWLRHAATQTKRLRQRVTVMSVGAATDALPIPDVNGSPQQCCGEAWIGEYAGRVRHVMQSYLRGGRARVVWLTPPEPRYGPRAAITHAINIAVERAAQGLRSVTVIRIDLLFSPGGYRDTIRYQGRDVRVREPDGVHLNVAGTAIAAKAVAQAIRAG